MGLRHSPLSQSGLWRRSYEVCYEFCLAIWYIGVRKNSVVQQQRIRFIID